jgi:type VI secretion system protein
VKPLVILTCTSYHKAELADGGIFHIEGPGGSVGRNSSSNICLPDPQKVISGCHARFSAEGDNIVITDESTNGLFVNGAAAALGRGNSTPVTNGMEIGIGEYLFTIEVLQTPTTASDRPAKLPHDDGVSNINFDPLADFTSDPPPAKETGFQEGAASLSPSFGVAAASDGLLKSSAEDFFDPLAPPMDAGSQMNNVNPRAEESHFSNLNHGDPLADPFSPPQGQFDDALSGGVEAIAGTGASIIPEDWMAEEQPPKFDAIPDPAPESTAPEILESSPEETESPSESAVGIAAGEASSDEIAPIQAHELVIPNRAPLLEEDGASGAEIPATPPIAEPPEINQQDAPEQPVASHQQAPSAKAAKGAVSVSAYAEAAALNDSEFEQAVLKGLMDLLAARANLKNEFRMGATLIRQTENNPLKFAANVEAAKILFSESSKNSAYLSRMEAVTQAMAEVQEHQMALLIGLRAAFTQLLQTFSPENFEENQSAGLSKIVSSSEKKAWLAYRKFYQERVAESDDPFEELFRDALAKAYLAALNNDQ